MDPEKIVALINETRAVLHKPPITVDDYQAMLKSDAPHMQLYKMAQKAGAIGRARFKLAESYDALPDGNPLARNYYLLMKAETTPENKEYNKALYAKMSTKEGACEVIHDTIKKLVNLPASVYFPQSSEEVIKNYEQYGDLMDAALNMELMRGSMKTAGFAFEPRIEQFLDNHKAFFNFFGMQASIARTFSSPFYPMLSEEVMDQASYSAVLIAKEEAKKHHRADPDSPEMKEMAQFGIDCMNPTQFAENADAMRRGQLLVKSGEFAKHRYAADNFLKTAEKATEQTKLTLMSEEDRQALDAALEGNTVMPVAEREILDAHLALERGVFSTENDFNLKHADEKMVKLFGPTFEYDGENLEEKVYTEENFKVSNYVLPEGCPFSREDAAFIGLASMALPEISLVSRMEEPEEVRLAGNFNFCTENLISGNPRSGLGPLIQPSIDKARKNVNNLITGYMNGNKADLARALAFCVTTATESFNFVDQYKKTGCYDGYIAHKALDMIVKDPEMTQYVMQNHLLPEKTMQTVVAGRKLSNLFEQRYDAMKRFREEINAGREPSDELKKELVTKALTLDLIGRQKMAASNAYMQTEEYQAQARVIQQWQAEHAAEPNAVKQLTAKYEAITRKAPMCDFMKQITRPYGMENLEYMVENSDVAKRLSALSAKQIIEGLQFTKANDMLDGKISEQVDGGLILDGSMMQFKDAIVMEPHKPFGHMTKAKLKEDAFTLSELTKGLADAQKNVHMGSDEFDNVELDLKLLERANRELLEDPRKLGAKNSDILRRQYNKLASDCNKYLARKERQGKLDVDPESKTGKRIRMVREALKYSRQGSEKYAATRDAILKAREERALQASAEELLKNSLTPETAGPLLKNLTQAGYQNADPERGRMIENQMKVVISYCSEHGYGNEQLGLTNLDYLHAMDVVTAHGAAKPPEQQQPKVNNPVIV